MTVSVIFFPKKKKLILGPIIFVPHLMWQCKFLGTFFPNCGNPARLCSRINPACLQGEKVLRKLCSEIFRRIQLCDKIMSFFFFNKLCSFYGKDFSKNSTIIRFRTSMILLQIVIMSSGTDLVKNHDSQSRVKKATES